MKLAPGGELEIPEGQKSLWIRNSYKEDGRAKIDRRDAFYVKQGGYIERNCTRGRFIYNVGEVTLSVEWADPNN